MGQRCCFTGATDYHLFYLWYMLIWSIWYIYIYTHNFGYDIYIYIYIWLYYIYIWFWYLWYRVHKPKGVSRCLPKEPTKDRMNKPMILEEHQEGDRDDHTMVIHCTFIGSILNLYIYLFVYLSIYLSVYLSIYVHVVWVTYMIYLYISDYIYIYIHI